MKKLLLGLLALAGCASEGPGNVLIMETELGEIQIELALEEAPITAGNFLKLAEGGHLDGARFYRVVRDNNDRGRPKIDVVQGGIQDDPAPFPPIPHESTAETGLLHVNGALSMARLHPGSATTEFFICVGDQPALDHGAERNSDKLGFAVFGRVTRGMDVVREIHATRESGLIGNGYVAGQVLAKPVEITRVVVK